VFLYFVFACVCSFSYILFVIGLNNLIYYSIILYFFSPIFIQIQEFTKEIAEYPLHSNGLIDVPKSLADIVESTIGAVFTDCNLSIDIVWKVLTHFSLNIIILNIVEMS
jgi:hypothetical protein